MKKKMFLSYILLVSIFLPISCSDMMNEYDDSAISDAIPSGPVLAEIIELNSSRNALYSSSELPNGNIITFKYRMSGGNALVFSIHTPYGEEVVPETEIITEYLYKSTFSYVILSDGRWVLAWTINATQRAYYTIGEMDGSYIEPILLPYTGKRVMPPLTAKLQNGGFVIMTTVHNSNTNKPAWIEWYDSDNNITHTLQINYGWESLLVPIAPRTSIVLDDGNILIGGFNTLTLNAYYIIIDQIGSIVKGRTVIESYAGVSITSNRAITKLSDGNFVYAYTRTNTDTRLVIMNPDGTSISRQTINYERSDCLNITQIKTKENRWILSYITYNAADYDLTTIIFDNVGNQIESFILGEYDGEHFYYLGASYSYPSMSFTALQSGHVFTIGYGRIPGDSQPYQGIYLYNRNLFDY